MWWFVILEVPHTENQPPGSKIVCSLQALFCGQFRLFDKTGSSLENKKNGDRNQVYILQRPYMPNSKPLCCLVRSTGALKINKGYIRKNSQKCLKIAISRSIIESFENETECDDLSSCEYLVPKISFLGQTLRPKIRILRPI